MSDDYEIDMELYCRMFNFIEDLENSTGDGKDPLKAEFWEKHKVTDEEKPSFLNLLCRTFRQTRRNNSAIIENAAYIEVEGD
jgi:DNA replication initiation complex subunit (GINS family)